MALFEAVIGFALILFLIRLLIRPSEVRFNHVFSLIFRVTDYLMKPIKKIFHNDLRTVLGTILILVLLRGILYSGLRPGLLLSGTGTSFLNLLRLLFQFYMVVWFISVLTKDSYTNSFMDITQRAFLPLSETAARLGVPRRHFSLFCFVLLLIAFSIISYLLYLLIVVGTTGLNVSVFRGFFEGLLLIIGLFQGFFSLVIIVGALLSWVSPDPYNPIVQAIYGISEPLLAPFRRFVPGMGGFDISPVIALLCFQFGGSLLHQIIRGLMQVI
jgi:YggT family protein